MPKTTQPGKPGRTSTYSEETAARIVSLMSDGTPLAAICRLDGMPALRTVYDWEEAHPEFAARIARARISGYDHIAADTLGIADDPELDVQHRKLQIETRLKLLAKWDPKRYGDKLQAEHSGPDGGPIQHSAIVRRVVDPKDVAK